MEQDLQFTLMLFNQWMATDGIYENLLRNLGNTGHCGASSSERHNGLEMLLSLSKVKIDVGNII